MTNSELVVRVLIEGAIGGALISIVAFLLSRFAADVAGRAFLVIFLMTATGAYFGFVVVAQAGLLWILIELSHIIAFGTMGLLGLRGSAHWLAAGWALHPVWDIGLHYIGPGTFAPWTYAIACATFDLAVAAYIELAYVIIGPHRLHFRNPIRAN